MKKTLTIQDLLQNGSPLIEMTEPHSNIRIIPVIVDRNDFPPYNIFDWDDGSTSLEISVAGYSKWRLHLDYENGALSISADSCDLTGGKLRKHGLRYDKAFVIVFDIEENSYIKFADVYDGVFMVSFTKTPCDYRFE